MGRTQEERKADTRARLLDAAADLFASDGFHATSTDAIAERAERTSGAVYAHFGGKDGLLQALLSDFEGAAVAEITEALDAAPDPSDRLRALWRSFAGTAAGDERWLLLEHELWLWSARHPDQADATARRYRSGRAGIAAAAESWADADHPLPIDPDPAAALVLALLLGLHMQRRVDPDAITDETATAGLALLLGLTPTT